MIRDAIAKVVSGISLSTDEAKVVMQEIMDGSASHSQMASFLTALRIKGETVDEITGLAEVMRDKAIEIKIANPLLDTCGTGGDKTGSFNVSTTAAFIAAGAGLKVAKHGNRAMSSNCGSADVLEALGIKIDLDSSSVEKCLTTAGIAFLFAQLFHPAMKHVAATRREIGIRTVFNILGPLCNPAKAEHQVIGVPDKELGEKLAHTLNRLGTRHSLIVHGLDGIDEISVTAKSIIWEIKEHHVLSPLTISIEDFGYEKTRSEDIKGGSPQINAEILRNILEGKRGAQRNVAVINAAAALVAGDLADNLFDAVKIAEEVIDSGKALAKLEQMIHVTQSLNQGNN